MKSKPTYKFLDGAKVVAWLQLHCGLVVEGPECNTCRLLGSDADVRRVYAARHEGARLSIDTVDRWLTRLGRHLWELSEDFWVPKFYSTWQHDKSTRAAAIAAYERGDSIESIKERWGVAKSTLMKWGAKRRHTVEFNGPALYEWMNERGFVHRSVTTPWDWKRGARPREKTVRRHLGKHGCTLDDLPEEVYG